MPSDFLISFHKEHFLESDVPIYSKEVFYKLMEKVNNDNKKTKNRF